MDQHLIILVLALAILALSLYLVVPKKEGYDQAINQPWPISSMSAKQAAKRLADPQCAADVNHYCKLASRMQPNMSDPSLSVATLEVMKSCGEQFPLDGVCAMNNPMFQLPNCTTCLGGTHNNKFGPY